MGGVGYFVIMIVVIFNKELCFKNFLNFIISEFWEVGYFFKGKSNSWIWNILNRYFGILCE